MSEKKEYIERGALLLALGEKRAVLNGLSEYGYLQVIREVPAADVEPVVRCKDCRRWHPTESDTPNERYCSVMGKFTRSSFYCGRAERSGSGE